MRARMTSGLSSFLILTVACSGPGPIGGAPAPATSPVAARPSWIWGAFGLMIGLTVALIRYFGNFPEGMMFAILLGNTFGPIAEEGINAYVVRRRAPARQGAS